MSEAIQRCERRRERPQILERLFELFDGNDPDAEIRQLQH